MNKVLSCAVSVVVVHPCPGPVDGELLKVGISMAVELSVKVREDTSWPVSAVGHHECFECAYILPCSKGSSVKSMPRTMCPGWNMTCSTSAK